MPISGFHGTSRTFVRLALVSLALSWPSLTPGADDSCRLTTSQKVRAVKAFKALSPIFHDPRCVNCHGAVNPFTVDGGHPEYINMVKVAKTFLNQADSRSKQIDKEGPAATRESQGIREIAESPVEVSDNDLIRMKALKPMENKCLEECHVEDWVPMPMSHNRFVGRSWKQICMHLKESADTGTPEDFLRHMQKDKQVLLGFKGQRGLQKPAGAAPPAMSFETMARHANAWIEAMGRNMYPPAECGCEVEGLALEIRHHMRTNPESSASKLGYFQFDGTVEFDVVLEEEAPGWFRNDDVVVRRNVDVKHTKPSAWLCSGKGWRDERWMMTARFDEAGETMKVSFNFVEEAQEASVTCTQKGYKITDPAYINVLGDLESLIMPTTDDAVGRASGQRPRGERDVRRVTQFEWITVSIIDRPPRRP